MSNNTPRTSCLPLFLKGTLLLLLIFAMMNSALAAVAPNVQTYDQLLSAIRDVRSSSEKVIDQEKVKVAWETGKLIDEHILQHKERAGYGHKVLERLAYDLSMSETELRYMLKFFRTYPIPPPAEELSWSRYREMLSLEDSKSKKEVTDEAVRKHWSRREVRAEVQKRISNSNYSNTETFPSVSPGKVFTYRVVKAIAGPYRGQLVLDLGFSNYFQPDGINPFKEGDIVILLDGKLKSVTGSEPFTYTAYVTEVIDGDTFHAVVDLGFKIMTDQKLRLRGLDAPEIESADGREAKEFLEKHGVRPGARILVRTVKSDKYDRYLADTFVDGNYINKLLFDEAWQ